MLTRLAWLGLTLPGPTAPGVAGGIEVPIAARVSLSSGAFVSPAPAGAAPAVDDWADYVRLRHAVWTAPGVHLGEGDGWRIGARMGGGVTWTRALSPVEGEAHDAPSPAAMVGAEVGYARSGWGVRLAERTWVTTATRLTPLETYAVVRPELSLAATRAW